MKLTMEEIKKENSALKEKCKDYEAVMEGLKEKVNTKVGAGDGMMGETKLEEWRKAWKKN
ncbi:hypothetical protein E2C01_067307 [Portunus trituberculatus]|uniref:Uncharacterized protein n=1 Tax=Portunus trituberculatus TaxID=210409 RepID=A0A5B7HJF6_PORTR|nr:hypothetical protein [Portunus trituberculatus]